MFFIFITVSFFLDLILGDPFFVIKIVSHPVIFMGKTIKFLEKKLLNLNDTKKMQQFKGFLICFFMITFYGGLTFFVIKLLHSVNYYLAATFEIFLMYQIFATKSLKDESMKVYNSKDLDEATTMLSYIVGRDTKDLSETDVYKATIETIAENITDAIIAPMLYLFIGGPVFGIIYKTVNTLDSMIGYKNDKYQYFGTFSARLDDVLNFLPARISAVIMIVASFFLKYDFKNAFKIWRRDRKNHKSPNSAQTESVCAGALNIQLAGDAFYFGKLVSKKTIGDNLRDVCNDDILKTIKLMYFSAIIAFFIILALSIFISYIL